MKSLLPLLLLGALGAAFGEGLGQGRGASKEAAEEASAVDPQEQLSLAAMLIGDGNWARAALALKAVDANHPELDQARYHTLLALLALQAQDNQGAVRELRAAMDAGADEPRLYAHLARALSGLEEPDLVGAWEVLEQASAKYPEQSMYDEQRVLILVELGLYQAARELGAQIQAERGLSVETQIVVGEAMHRAGQTEQGLVVLEQALLLHPEHEELPLHLARLYLAAEMPLTAALLLQRAVESQPKLALEAAECFRRAGQPERALMMNAQVPDPKDAARQRLGLLLEVQGYERALSLSTRLDRLGLLEEDEVRYGLAYSWYQSGDATQADALLKGISDPQVFTRATALRQAMDACVADGGCR